MNADTNRLPFRAGAMLLVAIAVVFIFLGVLQLNKSGDDPKADLEAASASEQAAEESMHPKTTSAKPETSTSKAPVDAADAPKLCVLNAGNVTGLAGEVAKTLTDKGFTVAETANLSTASVSENTIFYTPEQQEAAKKLAEQVPGGASLEARPDAFTRCLGQLAVVVVSR